VTLPRSKNKESGALLEPGFATVAAKADMVTTSTDIRREGDPRVFDLRLVRRAAAVAGALALGCGLTVASAQPISFQAPIMSAAGTSVGMARFVAVDGGVQITISVHDLPPGAHGLHIHEFGSCNPLRDTNGKVTPFGAAGGHFDPAMTNMHKGPDGGGHAGDLPNLIVDQAGNGGLAYFAPALHVSGADSIVGRSIMIHANTDNYSDTPPLGGSGARIACGEIGASV
jgi:Cu-Zn family superoxide dismutase